MGSILRRTDSAQVFRERGVMTYIVCKRRRSEPRLAISICRNKCRFKKTCPEYLRAIQLAKEKECNDEETTSMEREETSFCEGATI